MDRIGTLTAIMPTSTDDRLNHQEDILGDVRERLARIEQHLENQTKGKNVVYMFIGASMSAIIGWLLNTVLNFPPHTPHLR